MAKRAAKPADDELEDDKVTEVAEVEDEIVDESAESQASDDVDAGGEPVEEVQPPSWRERLGGEYATLDDDTAVGRLQEQLRQAQEAQRNAQQWQYLYAQTQQQAQLQSQQQAAAQAQQAQQASRPKWETPEFNRAWLQQLTRNEAGETVLKPGADPTILSKIQAYADWKEQQEQKFYQDPYQFILPGIQPHVEQIVQQHVQQALAYQTEQFAIQQWERDYAKVLTTDGRQIAADGSNVSPIGQAIVQKANELIQSGVTNRKAALDRAYEIVANSYEAAHYRQQQHKNGQPTQVQKQAAFLKKQVPRNRDGSFAKNGKPASVEPVRKSFREELVAAFEEAEGNTE